LQSVVQQIFSGARRTRTSSFLRHALTGLALLPVALAAAGCGNNYRPVVSAINPVGPAAQPQKYALVLADPRNGQPGVATLVNFSGDTVVGVLNTQPLISTPGPIPSSYLALDSSSQAYVLHPDTGLIEAFSASQNTPATPTFITRNVTQTTLPTGSRPLSALAVASANPAATTPTPGAVYIVEQGTTRVAALTNTTPPAIRQEFPVAANPVYVVGSPTSSRVYVLSQGDVPGTSLGTATGVENSSNNAISNVIPIGRSPVYGVVNNDARRAFILNRGGDATSGINGTVSVINIQSNALDTVPRVVVGPNPVWADVDIATNELAVLNAGDGNGPGSLSIINIPLCTALTVGTTPNCNVDNPVDAAGFGSVLATIPVGKNPVMVAVLQDQNKAYVANTDGTVTVVDMQTMVAIKTITVGGNLNWIAATSGSPTGKVYVTASDTQVLTAIRTDTDALVTTRIPLQGFGLAVRVTAP